MLTAYEQRKYYKLACNHTGIDRPVANYFSIPDDYSFMDRVEKQLGVGHVGNFRSDVCDLGFEKAVDKMRRDSEC
jgi:hypothetical protein